MKSRWDTQEARRAVERWGPAHGESLALRLYSARLIGAEPTLVLHGGGNVSLKTTRTNLYGDTVETLWIKGSGVDLASIEPHALTPMDLQYLRRMRGLAQLPDDAMRSELLARRLDASGPAPSIETLLHAFLPHAYVDHSHADALLALTNQPDGESHVRAALGERVALLPYVLPGFDLAKQAADLFERNPSVHGLVLMLHGLVTFGGSAQESYERHIAIVHACEQYLANNALRRLTVTYTTSKSPAELAALAGPLLRGATALPSGDEDRPFLRPVCEWRCAAAVLEFANSREAPELAESPPLTSDHLIRTKTHPLLIADPIWSDVQALDQQIRSGVEAFRGAYRAYMQQHGADPQRFDPSPSVVLLPGAGLFALGRTRGEARVAADVMEHTLAAKAAAFSIGRYCGLSAEHLAAMEFREWQRAKLAAEVQRPLERTIVMISGAAGAIGAAIAERCAAAGAHLVLCDLEQQRLALVTQRLAERFGGSVVEAVPMDVTDEASVRAGFEQACRAFGGVDVLVPNAGVAHVSPLDQLELAAFQRVMRVNVDGYLLFMREGARLLKRQRLGGNIVIISSKNVMGPGKDFGAYSASKAAGHQLGRVAALELAADNIRVNMIAPDAVFGHEDLSSGLWDQIGPQRAASRGLAPEQLPDFYRQRNLLRARVLGRHVGEAVVFFASNATPTTGASLPVDGGVADAFPR